ncbi:MAG TPA: hypothetical protein VK155_06195 [Bacteroidales bacterium]|jgi:hypothetical protein|nr:hypothetical protein [Bacteroidales bacterium]
MKRLLIILFLLGTGVAIFAQGDIDQQQKVFFRNERSFGILLNTDGIGISYRAAKRIDYLNKRIIEVDAGTLKSPKEYRQRLVQGQGSAYVFGKLNSTFYLRGGYGHQHEIYSKEDFGGIAIRFFYSAGPVFAIYKPIYYKVLYPIPGSQDLQVVEEKFDPNAIASPYEIYGRASFTKGFNEIKFMPGLYGKAGFNFEYSKEDRAIHAIEIGGVVNAFPKEIPIMAITKNKKYFFSLFVSYRFGMIMDPLHPETNRFRNIFKRSRRDDTQQYDQYQQYPY